MHTEAPQLWWTTCLHYILLKDSHSSEDRRGKVLESRNTSGRTLRVTSQFFCGATQLCLLGDLKLEGLTQTPAAEAGGWLTSRYVNLKDVTSSFRMVPCKAISSSSPSSGPHLARRPPLVHSFPSPGSPFPSCSLIEVACSES